MSIKPSSPAIPTAPERPAAGHAVIIPTALLLVPCLLAGCASGGVKNPFAGPTEARFTTLVKQNCGAQQVGGQSVSSLLASDSTFRQLTTRLYKGRISNDEFVNLLMQQYPSDDANIPATGCVVDQLARCFSSKCEPGPVQSPDAIAAGAMVAERDQTIDELPPADRAAVETMSTNFDSTPAEPVEPLPSKDPSVLAPSSATNPEPATQTGSETGTGPKPPSKT